MISKPRIFFLLTLLALSNGCFPAGIRLYDSSKSGEPVEGAASPAPPEEPPLPAPPEAQKIVIIRGTVTTPSSQ